MSVSKIEPFPVHISDDDLVDLRQADNIALYWFTGTGASTARWYWESSVLRAATATPSNR
jgi:hypothetical protein